MSRAAEPLREGELLAGKYRLEKLLGAGGMGQVYRAQNELIGRAVAIKVLRREYLQDVTIVQRFLREARAANMVRHANVVDVLDYGTDESGAPFIVQELLEGQDLASHMTAHDGRLSLRETLELMVPVIDAIGVAHVKGVVHRDLKPENVFLDERSGRTVPKVLDFGISKVATRHDEMGVTTTGVSLGTPAYMSPEQIRGARDLDARSDIWALGVMLYELLAGRRPFQASTPSAMFVAVCTLEPDPLAEAVPSLPRSIVDIVHRCLRAQPEQRYANAAELAADLRRAQSALPRVDVRLDAVAPPRPTPEALNETVVASEQPAVSAREPSGDPQTLASVTRNARNASPEAATRDERPARARRGGARMAVWGAAVALTAAVIWFGTGGARSGGPRATVDTRAAAPPRTAPVDPAPPPTPPAPTAPASVATPTPPVVPALPPPATPPPAATTPARATTTAPTRTRVRPARTPATATAPSAGTAPSRDRPMTGATRYE